MTQPTQIPRPSDRRPRQVQPLLREVYGRLLRRHRQRLGRTLAEVAAEAGISMTYLSEVERGLKEPSSEILAAVCGALGATVMQLVGAAHQELREQAVEAVEGMAASRRLDLARQRGARAGRERQPLTSVRSTAPSTGRSTVRTQVSLAA